LWVPVKGDFSWGFENSWDPINGRYYGRAYDLRNKQKGLLSMLEKRQKKT